MSDSDYSNLPEDIGNISLSYWSNAANRGAALGACGTLQSTTNTTPTELQAIQLMVNIFAQSTFNIQVLARIWPIGGGCLGYFQIYKNGHPFLTKTALTADWTTFNFDAVTGPWKVGDTIELWGWVDPGSPATTMSVQSLSIKANTTTFTPILGA